MPVLTQKLPTLLLLILWSVVGVSAQAADKVQPAAPLHVGKLKANKVLFLGNSITLHGPLESIGWKGNWGMAATSQDKDYVHLVTAQIQKVAGGKPEILVKNIADFERNHATYDVEKSLKEALDFKADIIVIAIGENVPGLATPEAQANYHKAFDNLLDQLHKHENATIFIRSTFWNDITKNSIMAECCHRDSDIFVDLGGLDKDEKNFARSEQKIEHAGVAGHPGDTGMKAIADAIWKAIEKRGQISK